MSLKRDLIFYFEQEIIEKVKQINDLKHKYPFLCTRAFILPVPHESCLSLIMVSFNSIMVTKSGQMLVTHTHKI